MRLAQEVDEPLVWISSSEPNAFENAFLQQYGAKRFVLPIMLDWRAEAVAPIYRNGWNELADEAPASGTELPKHVLPLEGVFLYDAKSLEDEAWHGVQSFVEWLARGHSQVGIIAQDRVVARRIRALLERAGMYVADETGWKLSTTRAAAAVMGWFDVIAARAKTLALLNFLKSPFVAAEQKEKPAQVMAIEILLRRANVLGGWDEARQAAAQHGAAYEWISRLAEFAHRFDDNRRKTLREWLELTEQALDGLEMRTALQRDPAGMQIRTC